MREEAARCVDVVQHLLTSIKKKVRTGHFGVCRRRDFSSMTCVSGKIDERTKRRSSYKERRANALAIGADEGRDKLRKAVVRSKYPSTHRYPNGETRSG